MAGANGSCEHDGRRVRDLDTIRLGCRHIAAALVSPPLPFRDAKTSISLLFENESRAPSRGHVFVSRCFTEKKKPRSAHSLLLRWSLFRFYLVSVRSIDIPPWSLHRPRGDARLCVFFGFLFFFFLDQLLILVLHAYAKRNPYCFGTRCRARKLRQEVGWQDGLNTLRFMRASLDLCWICALSLEIVRLD